MSRRPSMSQMIIEDCRRKLENERLNIQAQAYRLGVKDPTDRDILALLGRVQAAEQELRRPCVEARCRSLGIRTHDRFFWWKWPRNIAQMEYDCRREEESRRLAQKLGYPSK